MERLWRGERWQQGQRQQHYCGSGYDSGNIGIAIVIRWLIFVFVVIFFCWHCSVVFSGGMGGLNRAAI